MARLSFRPPRERLDGAHLASRADNVAATSLTNVVVLFGEGQNRNHSHFLVPRKVGPPHSSAGDGTSGSIEYVQVMICQSVK